MPLISPGGAQLAVEVRSSRPVKSCGKFTISQRDRYPTVVSAEAGTRLAENTGTAQGTKSNRSRPLCSAEIMSPPVMPFRVAVFSR
jgi:hypothetical protein